MSENTLILIHSLVRHGDKTTDPLTSYPNDPYKLNKYYPYGNGMLTNEGKRTMHATGKAFRERYDHFLGDFYLSELLETWSTEYERCRTSAQLFLAGLFPPKGIQKWNESLDWQPIPINYIPLERDEVMGAVIKSERFLKRYYNNFESGYPKDLIERNKNIISYIDEHSGIKITNTRQLFCLRDCFQTQKEYGLELPEWSKNIFPEKLSEIALNEYEMMVYTKELKSIVLGPLLRKILSDTYKKIENGSERKFHLYVGHDVNLATMSIILGLKCRDFPAYGAALTLEVHDINGKYGFKIFYKKDKKSDFEQMTVNNGQMILWLEDFCKIVDVTYNRA